MPFKTVGEIADIGKTALPGDALYVIPAASQKFLGQFQTKNADVFHGGDSGGLFKTPAEIGFIIAKFVADDRAERYFMLEKRHQIFIGHPACQTRS